MRMRMFDETSSDWELGRFTFVGNVDMDRMICWAVWDLHDMEWWDTAHVKC